MESLILIIAFIFLLSISIHTFFKHRAKEAQRAAEREASSPCEIVGPSLQVKPEVMVKRLLAQLKNPCDGKTIQHLQEHIKVLELFRYDPEKFMAIYSAKANASQAIFATGILFKDKNGIIYHALTSGEVAYQKSFNEHFMAWQTVDTHTLLLNMDSDERHWLKRFLEQTPSVSSHPPREVQADVWSQVWASNFPHHSDMSSSALMGETVFFHTDHAKR